MKLAELEARLVAFNVSKDMYCLTGGLPNEAYCIEEVNDTWRVYYSERGNRTGLKSFPTEEEACDDFFDRLAESGYVQR